MRKALLVLTMIGASFAGGAVVNGPGLAWLRSTVGLNPLRIGDLPDEGGDDSTSDEDSAFDGFATGEPKIMAAPKPERPRAPTKSPSDAVVLARPKRSRSHAVAPESRPATTDISVPPPLEAPRASRGSEEQQESVPAQPALKPIAEASPETPAPDASPRDAALSRTVDALRERSSKQDAAPAGRDAAPATNWTDLAQRLKGHGVTRYWIEGDAGGSARFRCIVPLVEGSAVSQQFDAEAGDPLAAAEMALRRVKLWRSTESR
jgi:hypothetical protein